MLKFVKIKIQFIKIIFICRDIAFIADGFYDSISSSDVIEQDGTYYGIILTTSFR